MFYLRLALGQIIIDLFSQLLIDNKVSLVIAWVFQKALAFAEKSLAAAGDPEAAQSATHLVAHAVGERGSQAASIVRRRALEISAASGKQATTLGSVPESLSLGTTAATALQSLLRRRAAREPVQYLLGEWDFHGLEGLRVGPPALVPRPETEELVELVLGALHRLRKARGIHDNGQSSKRPLRILDIGVGTGAIGLALLQAMPPQDESTPIVVVALEPHPAAFALAEANAKQFGLSDRYALFPGTFGDFVAARQGSHSVSNNEEPSTPTSWPAALPSAFGSFDPLHLQGSSSDEIRNDSNDNVDDMRFDLIVSNPPYIPSRDMLELAPEVAWYEDPGALCGGTDGLDLVREMLNHAPSLLAPGNLPTTDVGDAHEIPGNVWLELDLSHPSTLQAWLPPANATCVQPPTKKVAIMAESTPDAMPEKPPSGAYFVSAHNDFTRRARFVEIYCCETKALPLI